MNSKYFIKIVFLILRFGKLIHAVEQCQALFVVDGSSYYTAFRSEITSITTTANLAFSTTQSIFSANFWLYGNGDQDGLIPNVFFTSKTDFIDGVQALKSSGGSESIVGATSKLNQWEIYNAVIVIYTASPQNLITIAGSNYTEQGRTIAVHSNDGVDLTPLSMYPSPDMSEYTNLVELILNVCKHIPERTTTTKRPSTIGSTVSTATMPILECRAFFYLDASILGKDTVNDQIRLTSSTASLLFNSLAGNALYSNCNNIFVNCTLRFHAGIGDYGDMTSGTPNPAAFVGNYGDFLSTIDALTFDSPNDEDIANAIDNMNSNPDFSRVITILFTNSPQDSINNITKNDYQDLTLGFGISGQNMYHIADSTMNLNKPPRELAELIKTYCGWRF